MNEMNLYHDLAIIGLFHDLKQQILLIQAESNSGKKMLLKFNLVAGWDFSPFREQNILFNIYVFDKFSLPNWLREDFNVPEEFIKSIQSGKNKLFYLEASAGMEGYVVAEHLIFSTNQ